MCACVFRGVVVVAAGFVETDKSQRDFLFVAARLKEAAAQNLLCFFFPPLPWLERAIQRDYRAVERGVL